MVVAVAVPVPVDVVVGVVVGVFVVIVVVVVKFRDQMPFVGSVCPRGRVYGRGAALEFAREHPTRVGRKTHRSKERCFLIIHENPLRPAHAVARVIVGVVSVIVLRIFIIIVITMRPEINSNDFGGFWN